MELRAANFMVAAHSAPPTQGGVGIYSQHSHCCTMTLDAEAWPAGWAASQILSDYASND